MSVARSAVTVVATGILVAGCSGGDAAPDTTPDGAIVLRENQPATIDQAVVVATAVEGDDATLKISQGSSTSTPTSVSEGGSVSVGGRDFDVDAVWSEGDSGQPGGQGGRVMLVPKG